MTNQKTVYLIQAENTNLYKIGITSNIEKRLISFNTHCPYRVKTVYCIQSENAKEAERFLHVRYREQQTQLEWFALRDEQVQEIPALLESFSVKKEEPSKNKAPIKIEKDIQFGSENRNGSDRIETTKKEVIQYMQSFKPNEEGAIFSEITGIKFLARATKSNIDICLPSIKHLQIYTSFVADKSEASLFRIDRQEKLTFLAEACKKMRRKRIRIFWEGISLPCIIDAADVLTQDYFDGRFDFPDVKSLSEIRDGRKPSLSELSLLAVSLGVDYYTLKQMRQSEFT